MRVDPSKTAEILRDFEETEGCEKCSSNGNCVLQKLMGKQLAHLSQLELTRDRLERQLPPVHIVNHYAIEA